MDQYGNPAQCAELARRIGQSLADGEWLPGVHLDWPLNGRYGWEHTRETVLKALQLLAIRGELVLKGGKYYVVGSRGESS